MTKNNELDDYKGVYFECTICTLDYGLVTDRIPRVLNCGHTFCHSCLKQCLRNDAISCPFCAVVTQVTFSEISNIPINYSIIDMLAINMNSAKEEAENDYCEACATVPAAIVCLSCSPLGFKFCIECDNQEHDRPFKPVRLHRRIPLKDFEPTIMCSRHAGTPATHFSESLNQFACVQCHSETDWSTKSGQFLQVSDAAEQMRARAAKINLLCNNTMKQLHDTQKELDSTLLKLSDSASQAKFTITTEFKRLIDILDQRQQRLIKQVEEEYSDRKESLEKQKALVVERSKVLSGHHDQLKNLLQRQNEDFLRGYSHMTESILSYIRREDRSLIRPNATGDLPWFFKTSLQEELKTHGAVGGGPVPQNVICQKVPLQQSTLPRLSWSLSQSPYSSTEIAQYEVQYEHIPDERPPSPNNSGPIEPLPQSLVVAKSGKAQAHIMNDLVPGYRYLFRVRSRSIAGWGMWSQPITGRFEGFPVRVGFTGEKVSIRLPAGGEYRITAAGAKAADGDRCLGGRGAIMSGVFSFQKFDRIEMAVGGVSQKGNDGHSGGGGGTFVLLVNNGEITVERNLLVVAGGGGGTRGYDEQDEDGCDASLEHWGTDGRGREHGKGGREGLPGTDAIINLYQGPCWGYGGAGFRKSSKSAKCYLEGLEGGQCGGFGGGGGVSQLGSGGGGGYSGGGGGMGGGGGGSFVNPRATEVTKRVGNAGNGYVLIERVESLSNDPLVNIMRKESSVPNGNEKGSNNSSPNNTDLLSNTSSNFQ